MPSPTNDTPERPDSQRSDSERLSARLASLSPAQKALLQKRLAERKSGATSAPAEAKSQSTSGHGPHPIAIVGMGCRMPGAASPDEFWDLIDAQREAVGPVPPDRWDRDRFFDPTGRSPGKMSVDVIGALDQVDRFDPAFFGIAPREASRMDPQQRLLLEVAWETFENAGIPVDSMAGSQTGVFIGIGGTDYSKVPAQYSNYFEHVDAHIGTGNALSIAAGRISYLLDLHGPSFIVDTACSSALVAIHSATVSLMRGECDAALAGGVNLILSPETTIAFSKARMLSPDGHCRPFDQAANGYVRGEGCGLVLLKRLSDAIDSGDHVLGVIRGSAVNQDGRTSGITAPSGPAQQRVIGSAMESAGVTVDDISYVEAHGTATPLGDPIELMALDETFAKRSDDLPPVRFGSVKANIGHTETVSGVAGLLKVLQMFAHDHVPAQANFASLNPSAQMRSGKLRVAEKSEAWAPNADGRRIAGVSSFGFGGTNAHLIVEKLADSLRRDAGTDQRTAPPSLCMPLSSRDASALHELAGRMNHCLDHLDDTRIHDACVTAATDRTSLPIRAVVVADSAADLKKSLADLSTGIDSANVIRGQSPAGRRPRIAMLFTGQGSQYLKMAGELRQSLSCFRQSLEQCAEILDPELPLPLLDVLSVESPDHSIDHTSLAQPAICAVQCALVDSLRSVGIRADVVAGHSIGEIAALYAAGALNRSQALLLSAYRGKVMGDLPAGGAMAAMLTDAETVASWIEQSDSSAVIATMNGSTNTVVAGDDTAIKDLVAIGKKHNVMCRQLAVSHAFHSPLMKDAADPLRERLRTLFTSISIPNAITFISSVTGQPITGSIDVEYWIRHLLQPVRFTDVIKQLQGAKLDLAIEVAAQSQLCNMISREEPESTTTLVRCVGTLNTNQNDYRCWIKAVASAWSVGAKVDWSAVHHDYPARRVALPTYPFQRQRYWYDPPTVGHHAVGGSVVHPLLGTHQPLATGGSLYSTTIRDSDPSYLADHVVSGSVTVPAAAWVEALRAAASESFKGESFELEKVEIERALFVESGEPVEIQTSVQAVRGGRCRIQIDARRGGEDASWQTCASAVAMKCRSSNTPTTRLQRPGSSGHSIDTHGLYDAMSESGLEYGEFFQVLHEIASDGRSASARLAIATELDFESHRFRLHPTLLDGALQLIATVVPQQDGISGKQTFLPVGVERLTLFEGGAIARATVWRRTPDDDVGSEGFSEIVADVELLDQDDQLVAQLQGVRLKSLRREKSAAEQDPATWLHQTVWTIVGEMSENGSQSSLPLRHFGSNSLETLVTTAVDAETNPREHWIWTGPPTDANIVQTVDDATDSLLNTIQSAIRHEPPPQLSIVTTCAFAVASDDESVDPVATAIVGMIRVATNEHPQLEIRLLDVDQVDEPSADSISLWLKRSSDETELALRRNLFFKPRIARAPRLLAANDPSAEIGLPPGGSYRVRLDGTDRTEGLWVQRMAPPPVETGRVQINVNAVGLNFSDVLKSMGLYPGIRDKVVPLGIEVCGRVTKTAADVDSVSVGMRVMGVAAYGFASDAVTNEYLLTPVPDWLSDDEAACLPIAFLTAHHALLHVGRLCEGESVLIHAGAGGVGLAAIQIAQSIGATVYTTAGHPTKRRLLAMLGVDERNIFDSRDLRSIDLIRERTGGRGVDVVLNSLPGEWIDASIGLLAAHGRFLEIGKIDIYQNHAIGLLPFQDNLTYAAIDLDRLFRERPEQVRTLFAEVSNQFIRRVYGPLPLTSYRLDELPSAMRFMAARRNIGKIVVKPPRAAADVVSTRGVHLITGGSGAIGMGVARRLIERGASAIALVGRSPASNEIAEMIGWAESRGAKCVYLQADCADESALRIAKDSIAKNFGPIVGVVHAAGLLDDGLIHEMSTESLHRVLRPKVAGAVALDRVTRDQPVETFIMLGSVASVFGSPGQANYAAANAFLEGFARDRLRRGLPASLVHWGPWASAGMADDPTRIRNLAARGLRPLRFDAALDMLIDASAGQCSAGTLVVDADWNRMLSAASEEDLPSILRGLRSGGGESAIGTGTTKDESLIAELRELDEDGRSERLAIYFAEQLGRIMSMDASSIDPAQPLGALGLDSLMAIELKNTIEAKLDITLPISRFMDDPTLESLSAAAAEILTPATAE